MPSEDQMREHIDLERFARVFLGMSGDDIQVSDTDAINAVIKAELEMVRREAQDENGD
jgi:hypothetical protein